MYSLIGRCGLVNCLTGSCILVKISIHMLNFLKSFYAFLEDPINYILCNFQLAIRMFSTILMPTKICPGFGSGSQALVPASIPSHRVSPGRKHRHLTPWEYLKSE